ncbi:MAG: glycoside hydrolase, partial [Bryobacteraceae bacterium]
DPGAEFSQAKYDPVYRLPLYEAAFHASLVATDRWDVPMTKFPALLKTRQLLELLYGVPSIWAMDRRQLRESGAALTRLMQFFEPLHRRIGALPLTDFEWLTRDRLVQRTTFGNEATLKVNFGSARFSDVEPGCVRVDWIASRQSDSFCP